MIQRLYTVAEVAEALGPSATERYVTQKCRTGGWPHRRLARGAIGFTAEDYAAVLDLIAAPTTAADAPRLSFAPRSRRRAS